MMLPPYGFMNESYQSELTSEPLMPADWRLRPGVVPDEQEWLAWRRSLLHEIHQDLWPHWDPTCSQWVGKSAAQMEALTRCDLELLDAMERTLPSRGLDQLIQGPYRSPAASTQRQIFEDEDDRGRPFASYFGEYDDRLTATVAGSVPVLFMRSLATKSGTVSLQVKVDLQRPRAYQVAMLFGWERYVNQEGRTASTPAMCSGHCLEGLLAIGGVIDHLLTLDRESPDLFDALQQYAVDIGDRRVMAGIHYPSDNICSWFILMRLADGVFRHPRTKSLLWDAITTKSMVYQAILQFVKQGRGSAYLPGLALLKKAVACDEPALQR